MISESKEIDGYEVSLKDIVRFLSFVKEDEKGCWVWQGHRDAKGYGQFWWNGNPVWAHRFAHAIFIGIVPKKHHVHHKHGCRNPSCCNPEHIQQITHKANSKDGAWVREHRRKILVDATCLLFERD